MKNLLCYSLVVLGTLSLCGTSSCKKDDDDPVCRIATISNTNTGGTTLISLTYNNEGKLTAVTAAGAGSYSRTFTHSSNSILVTEKNGAGTITGTNEVTLNNSGNISNIISKNAVGAITSTASMEYNGSGNLTRYITSTLGTSDTSIANFNEGNLTSIINGVDVTTLTYYTDKSFMDGDYLKLTQMLGFSALYVLNRNLVKSYSSGTGTTNFTYEFDNTGKITMMTITSGTSSDVYNYSYNCN